MGNEIALEWERERLITLAREQVDAMKTAGLLDDLDAIQYLAEMTAPLLPREPDKRRGSHRRVSRKARDDAWKDSQLFEEKGFGRAKEIYRNHLAVNRPEDDTP